MNNNEVILSNNAFRDYINEIRKYQVLKKEEQENLFVELEKGSTTAFDQLFYGNLRLVVSIVIRKFLKCNENIAMDMVQEGNIALMKAIKNYNIKDGVCFSSFACIAVINAISRYLDLMEKSYRVPSVKNHQFRLYLKALNKLANDLEREPTLEEISRELNMPYDKVKNFYFLDLAQISIDQLILNNSDNAVKKKYEDFLADPNNDIDTTFENCYREEQRKVLFAIFKKLKFTEKQIQILILRYGFDNNEPMKLKDIAKLYNDTRQNISLMEQTALKKLRNSSYLKYLMYFKNNPEELYDEEFIKIKEKSLFD